MSTTKYKVEVVQEAESDLYELYHYVMRNDSVMAADKLLDKLEDVCEKLSTFPERGNYPHELKRIGVTEYREVHFKSYRIIYQIIAKNIYVHAVLDGRRDLEEYLLNRLIVN